MPLSYDPQAALVPVKISPFFRDEAQTERQMDTGGEEGAGRGKGRGSESSFTANTEPCCICCSSCASRVELSRTLSCSGSCTWRSCLKPASIYMYG